MDSYAICVLVGLSHSRVDGASPAHMHSFGSHSLGTTLLSVVPKVEGDLLQVKEDRPEVDCSLPKMSLGTDGNYRIYNGVSTT